MCVCMEQRERLFLFARLCPCWRVLKTRAQSPHPRRWLRFIFFLYIYFLPVPMLACFENASSTSSSEAVASSTPFSRIILMKSTSLSLELVGSTAWIPCIPCVARTAPASSEPTNTLPCILCVPCTAPAPSEPTNCNLVDSRGDASAHLDALCFCFSPLCLVEFDYWFSLV